MHVCLCIPACYGSIHNKGLPPNERHKYFVGRKLLF
jgi:hypothetical protein